MKRILSMAALITVAAATSLVAQSHKLVVKAGKTFTYATSSEMNIVQSIMGQEMAVTTESDGVTELKVRKMGKGTIDWTFAIPRLRTKSSNPMSGEVDTTISVQATPFSTNPQGTVSPTAAVSDVIASLTGGGMQQMSIQQFFSPALSRSLTKGDTWEESALDTTLNNGVEVHITRNILYTFDGPVDTLNVSTFRIRAGSTDMKLDGAGSVQGGINLQIEGEGSMNNIFYYSAKDGMLVATSGDGSITAQVVMSGAMDMIVPMTYKIGTTLYRK